MRTKIELIAIGKRIWQNERRCSHHGGIFSTHILSSVPDKRHKLICADVTFIKLNNKRGYQGNGLGTNTRAVDCYHFIAFCSVYFHFAVF